jgi:hypothetical protein
MVTNIPVHQGRICFGEFLLGVKHEKTNTVILFGNGFSMWKHRHNKFIIDE